MKNKKLTILFTAVIVLLSICFSACSTLKTSKTYSEYYFSNESIGFYPSTRTVVFNKDGTFSMSAYGSELLKGKYTNYKNDKYIRMIYDNQITDESVEQYRKYLSDEGMNFTVEEVTELLKSLVLYDDYYYYKDYLFCNDAIQAYRQIDLNNDVGYNYTSIEGEYVVGNNTQTYLLKLSEGIAYSKAVKSNDNETLEYTQVGTYTVEKDFLVLSINSSEGTRKVKYLIARFSMPTEVAYEIENQDENTSSDWSEQIQKSLIELEGRQITCLVKYFFSTEKLA